MPDERLRRLERRWKETDTVADKVAYIKERLRMEDLSREVVELAAGLGSLVCRLVLDQEELSLQMMVDLETWGRSIRDAEMIARALIALEAEFRDRDTSLYSLREHFLSVELLEESIVDGAFRENYEDLFMEASHMLSRNLVSAVVEVIGDVEIGAGLYNLTSELHWLVDLGDSDFTVRFLGGPEKSNPRHEVAVKRVHEIVLSELIPWVLGERDPVRERVEARRRVCIQTEVEEEVEDVLGEGNE